jgi:tetratricopeptide (TPR) repeat protein
VREALEADVSASRRAWLHRQAAETLSRRPDPEPTSLAYHARLAGDDALRAQGLLAAARIASARFDQATALSLLEEAAAALPSPAIERLRAQVLIRCSRYAEAAAAAATAMAAEPTADSYEIAAQTAYYNDKDFRLSADLARTAADMADDAVQRMRCLAFAGRAMQAEGAILDGAATLSAALAEPAAAAVPELRLYLGAIRMHEGRADEAVHLMTAIDAAADPLGFAPVVSALMRGLAHAQLGRPLEALADFDRCDRLAEERQLRRYAGRPQNCRGYVLRSLGRLDAARECNEYAADVGHTIGQLEAEGHAYVDLVDDRLERGDLDGAGTLLEQCAGLAAVPHVNRWRHAMRRRLLHARLALASGDPGTAEDLAEELVAEATARGIGRHVVLARLVAACARTFAGREVDRSAVEEDLARLDVVAGVDGWRVTLDVAGYFGSTPWRDLALARADRLATAAGVLGEDLRDYAGRRASSTTMRTAQG